MDKLKIFMYSRKNINHKISTKNYKLEDTLWQTHKKTILS